MTYYTGIGSRRTPAPVLTRMVQIARALATAGWTLRTGGAQGADSAFVYGALTGAPGHDWETAHADVYVPWRGFGRSTGRGEGAGRVPGAEALALAATVHPAWERCSPSVRLLHARNAYEILGRTLDQPSACVIAWTPLGEVVGGTATALRLAARYGISVWNLGASPAVQAVVLDEWRGNWPDLAPVLGDPWTGRTRQRLADARGSDRAGYGCAPAPATNA